MYHLLVVPPLHLAKRGTHRGTPFGGAFRFVGALSGGGFAVLWFVLVKLLYGPEPEILFIETQY